MSAGSETGPPTATVTGQRASGSGTRPRASRRAHVAPTATGSAVSGTTATVSVSRTTVSAAGAAASRCSSASPSRLAGPAP